MRRLFRTYYSYYFKKRDLYRKYGFLYSVTSILFIFLWVFAFKSSVLDANNIPSGSMEPTLKVGDFLFVNKMRYTLDIPFTNFHLIRFGSPQRGDIITFKPRKGSNLYGKTLVKRVIGVPGDIIEVVDDEIYVNGVHYPVAELEDKSPLYDLGNPDIEYMELYKETIVNPANGEKVKDHYIIKNLVNIEEHMRFPKRVWIIPEGKYMAMGDNRDNSDDSRGCSFLDSRYAYDQCRQSKMYREYPLSSTEWGLVDLEQIHGKVYLIYFSVNWGDNAIAVDNPFKNFFMWMKGELPNVNIRAKRIFKRIN